MFEFEPIGYLKCDRSFHTQQPAQGVLSDSEGVIELIKGYNYEQGLKDLSGFDYIWVIYLFHRNTNWKPLTNPPHNDENGKKGVFATRSPYRPNPIGLSCVKLDRIENNKVYVKNSDLLNDTPILDIKPYIPEYDSFPAARRGWLENVDKQIFEVVYSNAAKSKADYLFKRGADLYGVIDAQLKHNPFDKTRNKFCTTETGYLLRFKSWRIKFEIENKTVKINEIESAYSSFGTALGNDSAEDIKIHIEFKKTFVLR